VKLLVTIGLDADLVQKLRGVLDARLVAYASPPSLHSIDGRVHVESATVAGRWLQPDGVIYYGYFEEAAAVRRSLALGDIPTFPDVRATIALDDRALALIAALRVDERGPGRGYLPQATELAVRERQVLKWGNRHCGDDKGLVEGAIVAEHDSIVEPFVVGRSERILIVGERTWHLRYESDDWRKNVRANVTTIDPEPRLVARARQTAARLGLDVAGVDYVVGDDGAVLLEVNAYPGLEDLPDAAEAFVACATQWWERIAC